MLGCWGADAELLGFVGLLGSIGLVEFRKPKTLKVSSKFERLRPANIAFEGLLEIRRELVGLLELLESTLVGGWRSTPFEVRGKTFVVRCCGTDVRPSESKTLNTLKVASKFERVRPAKVVLGGLLEIRKELLGLTKD